jgi:glycosyltransferase involved in cell wall biosynthesis
MIKTNKLTTLEFLIPSYKRPHTVIQAVESVAKQIEELKLSERVKITIVDDCSPNLDVDEIINAIYAFSSFVSFKQNDVNKGMSLNIRDMVANSNADFCTILTDDDRLQPNSLEQIIKTLDSLDELKNNNVVGSFFVPRYSYLEDLSLHCIVCNPFVKNTLITPSPTNSIKYLYNGFILTGLFFQPKLINFQLWDDNIENSFFPVIYFADLLLNYNCLYVNENWFIHTVLNECHWDSWGNTEQKRLSRLYKDYMQAISISSEKSLSKTSGILSIVSVLIEEFRCYVDQIKSTLPQLSQENRNVNELTDSRIIYKLAYILACILIVIRLKLSSLKSILIES